MSLVLGGGGGRGDEGVIAIKLRPGVKCSWLLMIILSDLHSTE